MSKIYLRFSHNTINDIQDNQYLFDTSITIREMLESFLKQTNSINMFMFGTKILNQNVYFLQFP